MPLITESLVALDTDLGDTKQDVIASLAGLVQAAGRADADGLTADALERESKAATGLPGGFAIPHCRSAAVTEASLAFARLARPVDFGAKDGPADLVFLIAAAADGDADHLKLLTKLARALVKKDFLAALRAAATPAEIVALVDGVVNPPESPTAAPVPAAAAPAAAAQVPTDRPLIVAVTACPTGIAHTYMAADSLVAAGQEAGVDVHVETQGSGGVTPLPAATIARASAAIFATDVGVKDMARFAGLPVIESGVKRAISEPGVMITEALAAAKNPQARKVAAGGGSGEEAAGEGSQLSVGKKVMQALMTGVSYMLPFVAAGGLLIALGFLFGGFDISLAPGSSSAARTCAALTWADPSACASASSIADLAIATGWGAGVDYLGAVLFTIGAAAFGFLVPALSGYIAYGIAGRPGIAPGFVGGAISATLGAGFLGGILTGLLAGVVALWLANRKVPRWLAGLMPVVVIPLVTTLIVGGLMYFLLGAPLASLTVAMQAALTGMSGGSKIALGVILGLMMCFDLGGPVNKAAYLFATAGLSPDNPASLQIMAAVMAAGMVPPIAMSVATFVRKAVFNKAERENGQSAWLLGLAFISEGAIPFAAADPLRVIPSMMAGGAVTGALTMALGVGSYAPHGGVFVFFAIQNFVGFLIAIAVGVLVSAALVIALKQFTRKKTPVQAA
ncbi:MAG TPA: fructose-specific PTS transporter subunit EIIC [Propioniciclava sp.]|uniref:PTS fructose transporter subunit IIABC n=1 Tax=Propioniciclava sp. TaxID=2038686 RepID=UPI002CE24B7F|nr:fructose-specific PTS transporter subunit EIIC [Propioniciclava sp.]HRL49314.1 fructose-specific PTS transporter subunit EIIC [Propioniciclava sp.]HRL79022.1 fructose-specific PTS transporter subunit EIIC [Propioniciclava sp.]